MAKDYYAVLGVAKTAPPDEIKKAFRAKAHQYHPDKKGGDEVKFKELNEAYQVLSNTDKRAKYDQFGAGFDQAGFGGGAGGFNWQDFARQGAGHQGNVHFDFGDVGDLGEMFSDIFGGGGRRGGGRRGSKGADQAVHLTIDFLEAIFGVAKTIELERLQTCSHCQGTGGEPGSQTTTCDTCHGRGQVERVQQSFMGMMRTIAACPNCHGEGKKIEQRCRQCSGTGVKRGRETLKVSIPAGISDQQTIQLRGKGEAGKLGQPAGDLYFQIEVRPDSRWQRQGDDIVTQEKISFRQAALGDQIDIATVHGPVKLKIPEGTQSGKVFKLAGKGVPRLERGGVGDQLVKVVVQTPTRLNRAQKRALEELG
ncbi:MAG: molecular chaperone DnaJ [Patescibacteria group bacterium]